MSHPHRLYRLLTSLLIIAMLLGPAQMPSSTAAPAAPVGSLQSAASDLYRTRVVVDGPARRARLDALDLTVLTEGPGWALVLADDGQLEALARLRFEPGATDDLAVMVNAHAAEQAWLAQSLRPLLTEVEAIQREQAAGPDGAATTPNSTTTATLRTTLKDLSPKQIY